MNSEKTSFWKSKKFTILLIICAAVALAIVLNLDKVGGIFSWLGNVFGSIILGGCIAFVLNILMDFFSNKVFKHIKHQGLQTTFSLLCAILVILLVIVGVILVVVPQLFQTFSLLAQKLPGFLKNTIATLENLTKNYPELSRALSSTRQTADSFGTSLMNFVKEALPKTLSQTYSVAAGSVRSVMTIAIALLLALYFLIFKKSLGKQSREFCYTFFKTKTANQILYVAHLLSDYFRAFIYGRVADAICVAILYLIPALLLRLPYTAMITTIFGVFSIIPLFGPLISWGLGLFFMLTSSLYHAIIFTILFVIILLVTRNVIYPKIIGEKIGLPDFWVLFAVIIGGKMFGIVGMLTAVPVFALIYTLVNQVMEKQMTEHPDEVKEILDKPDWDTYNPQTKLFEGQPVHYVDPINPPPEKKKKKW